MKLRPDNTQYDNDWAIILLLDYAAFFWVVVIPFLKR